MTATRTATVEFRGTRPTTEIITWGQRAIWTAIERMSPNDAYFNFVKLMPLSDTDIDTVLAALGHVIGRHEALHTRIVSVDGEPHQQVGAGGELAVEIIEAGDEDITALATATGDRYADARFDYAHDWPLRAAVLTRAGAPAMLALCFCHLATDFGGSMVVLADLAALIAGGELGANTATQPVDLARYQRSPAGRRAAKAAANYWERAYERIPPSMFEHEIAAPERIRFHRAYLLSPGLSKAAELVGERLGTGSSAVLNAAFAVTIGALTKHDTCALLTITKNRWLPRTRDMVSTLALEGLLVVPLNDLPDFDEAVRAAWRAAMPAYRYAQYDELDRDRIVRAASERRGEFIHPYCCLNDLRDDTVTGIPYADTPLAALAARSRIDWAPPLAKVDCRFCLHVADATEGMAVRVTCDSAYLPRRHVLAFLKSVDSLVIAAADGPVPLPAALVNN
ncbi:MAG TPA: condensation domain-containing protein [Pseudonocardiaceae bacterium]